MINSKSFFVENVYIMYAYLIVFFAPINSILISVGVLVSIDFIFGIMSARKRGEAITSKRMRDTVIKALVYQSAIVVGHMVELHLMDILPLVKVISGFIAMVELKSLSESYFTLTGLRFMDAINQYLNKKK